MSRKTLYLAAIMIALIPAEKAHSEAPNLLTYHGRLKESGQPVTGNRQVEIKLCPTLTGSDGLCKTTGAQGTPVSNALFRSTFTLPADVDLAAGDWYLEVWVGADHLSPREKLTSSPYALYSATASYANALAASPGASGIFASSSVFVTNGNVGIGTTNPAQTLDVNGTAQFGSTAKSAFTTAGALVLPADPTAALQATTKQYVDAAVVPSTFCPAGMAYISGPGPEPYCIDQYEAYLAGGTVTNCACSNGSKAEVDACAGTAVAGSASGRTPLVNINWCAAKKACANAGKHLLTNMEWFAAANYKGSQYNITTEGAGGLGCNVSGGGATLTGANSGCVTQEGVYDMIGNVWEWVDRIYTADPTNGVGSGYITGYDFATGIPASVGSASPAFGNDYYNAYNGGGSARAVLRGGLWVYGALAGVFAFDASNAPSDGYGDIGFRCGRRP